MREVLPIARGSLSSSMTTRLAIASVGCVILFSLLFLRLWALTVLSGDRYVELAKNNQVRQLAVPAPRGAIIDRNGRPLVTNRADREVVVFMRDVPRERVPILFEQLSRVLDMPVSEIKKKVRRHGADPLTPVVLKRDVLDDRMLFYLEEHRSDFPGVAVRERFARSYPGRTLAAHVLGQVGEVGPEQLKHEFRSLRPGDDVGQTGLERTYDEYLRGKDGFRGIEVDAAGIPQRYTHGLPATPGNNLRLTIDAGLQRQTELALMEGIRIAHSSGEGRRAYAGAAVAMDPRNGEVLALASLPTYDPNIFMRADDRAITRLLRDRRTPLSNRAISGLYPPGSVFKPITAIAALSEGFVKPDTLLGCPNAMTIAGTKFRNWNDEPLAPMDMPEAMAQSCDTYFYALSLDFYNTPGSRLQDWARRFGLGKPTGIDLPGEEGGLVPTPAWRRETFEGWSSVWSPGHSVNLSIGQGDLLVTPLQMTAAYVALANGGTIYAPRLAQSVEDPGGKVLVGLSGTQSKSLPVTKEMLKPIHDGLFRAAHSPEGTSSAIFGTFPIAVSGKTGTAEKPPHGDMAWYCGYAPAAEPTIAACALIESGGHGGTAAAPVVLRMFQQYFDEQGGRIITRKRTD